MADAASTLLPPWASFYVMTGSAAAALTGLMFIVITLVSGMERMRRNPDGTSIYSTPTVVHFCAAFFISAILSAPWHGLRSPTVVIAIASLTGVAYVARTALRARRIASYQPDPEDWASYSVLPFVAYAAILVGALLLSVHTLAPDGLFAIGGGVVLLILVGIHNAWDVVTFIAMGGPPE